jgi:menaquinone-dependent protoporphyrinogen oxidase
MNNHILVSYATRAGSTAEIAAAIGENLRLRGFCVEVEPMKEKPSINGFRAVVLGSAVRMGKWLPEAVDYIKANQAELKTIPTALFTVHMLNTGTDDTSNANRRGYLNAVRPLLNKPTEGYFKGKVDYSCLSFIDRRIAEMTKVVEADNREWHKIRNWAKAIFPWKCPSFDNNKIYVIEERDAKEISGRLIW